MLTLDRIRSALSYDPASGVFIRKYSRSIGHFCGKQAGALRRDGYVQISIDGTIYLAHRLAWFWVHGKWPPAQIDHIDGDRVNNRISNLRQATHAENQKNHRRPRVGSASGAKGVHFEKRTNKWRAIITSDGQIYRLGRYSEKGDAIMAYNEASANLHGAFASPSMGLVGIADVKPQEV